MTTSTDICNAFAPEYLARSPHLPVSHQKTISAIQHCRTGHDGHSLYACQSCAQQHRVNHSGGHRHGPQCPHHQTQQGLHHHLETHLPGPHVLLTCTVPEALRPCIRSHQRIASSALCKAAATALKRLAQEERFIGTTLPGCTGILHPWGRQLQDHPHIHDIVPGGGLSKDRTTWRPSRANFFVPVQALSPISRALCKEDMRHAGLLEDIDPHVWDIPWHVPSQANPHGHTSFTYLAPSVCKVAISKSRIISRTHRTVPFTYRTPGSARKRPTTLDAIECIRRFFQHVLPDGFMKVRHVGLMHASGAISTDTMRLMILKRHPIGFKTPHVEAPAPLVASCPTCGKPMPLVMRLWTSTSVFLDTG